MITDLIDKVSAYFLGFCLALGLVVVMMAKNTSLIHILNVQSQNSTITFTVTCHSQKSGYGRCEIQEGDNHE